MKHKHYYKLFLIILWMSVIFYFSSQSGDESSQTSGFVIDLLTRVGIDVNSVFGNITQFVIRKSAHMFEYFVLFFLLYYFIKDFLTSNMNLYLSVFIASLYACLDELHQTFVPMRSGSIIDVGIDTFGALIGMSLVLFIRFFKQRKINIS